MLVTGCALLANATAQKPLDVQVNPNPLLTHAEGVFTLRTAIRL